MVMGIERSVWQIAEPNDKGKGKAVEEGLEELAAAQQPAPDSEAAQAMKAARDRVRLWQRLRLEGLALLADVLETCEGALGRKRNKNPDDATDAEARLLAIRDDLQQVTCPSQNLLREVDLYRYVSGSTTLCRSSLQTMVCLASMCVQKDAGCEVLHIRMHRPCIIRDSGPLIRAKRVY